jgi:hypothetical protein
VCPGDVVVADGDGVVVVRRLRGVLHLHAEEPHVHAAGPPREPGAPVDRNRRAVFPQPDGPSIEKNSPLRICIET